jgi:hypothetical protein
MQSKARLLCIDPATVNVLWPLAREMIKSAFDRTGLSDFGETEKEVLSGLQLLWIAWNGEKIEAAATTQLIKVGSRKICVLVACGGKHRERWVPLLDGIEDYARKEGCAGMRIYGRKGWERALSGYHARHVILQKELA